MQAESKNHIDRPQFRGREWRRKKKKERDTKCFRRIGVAANTRSHVRM